MVWAMRLKGVIIALFCYSSLAVYTRRSMFIKMCIALIVYWPVMQADRKRLGSAEFVPHASYIHTRQNRTRCAISGKLKEMINKRKIWWKTTKSGSTS